MKNTSTPPIKLSFFNRSYLNMASSHIFGSAHSLNQFRLIHRFCAESIHLNFTNGLWINEQLLIFHLISPNWMENFFFPNKRFKLQNVFISYFISFFEFFFLSPVRLKYLKNVSNESKRMWKSPVELIERHSVPTHTKKIKNWFSYIFPSNFFF